MIQGKEIYLKAIEKDQATNYYNWINDSATNDWRGLYHPTSIEGAENWICSLSMKSDELNLAIFDKKDNVHIGFIGLKSICPRSRRAEVWVYVGNKDYWNKGVGSDAVSTLSDYSFNQMNLHRIWLECNPEYTNVVKCYEKVGFVREGLMREAYYRHGKYRDVCIMGLLKRDFIAKE